jgi:hypothetical protein
VAAVTVGGFERRTAGWKSVCLDGPAAGHLGQVRRGFLRSESTCLFGTEMNVAFDASGAALA